MTREIKPLHGVGGWLALFIFITMVVSFVLGSGSLYGELANATDKYPDLKFDKNFQAMSRAYWYAFWFFYAIRFIYGYRLWKIHTWSSVSFAIKAMWFCAIAMPITDIAIASAFSPNLPSGVVAEWLGSTIGSALVTAFWTAYLLRSRRVRNTYPKTFVPGDQIEVAAVSSTPVPSRTRRTALRFSRIFDNANTRGKRIALVAAPFFGVAAIFRLVRDNDYGDVPSALFVLLAMATILCLLVALTRLGDWLGKQ